MTFAAAFLRPFATLAVFVCIVWPIKALVFRLMKDGPLKRLLFTEIGKKP
jgi:hypothetical protein